MSLFSIESSDTDAVLEFSDRQGDQFVISYTRLGTTVQLKSSDYTDEGGIARFLETLSTSTLPSEREYQWKSLEGDLSMVGTCDKLGHVIITFRLIDIQGHPEQWTFTGSLLTDFGLLPKFAQQAKQFFGMG